MTTTIDNSIDSFFLRLYGEDITDTHDPVLCIWTKENKETYPFLLSDLHNNIPLIQSLAETDDVYFGVGLQKDMPPDGKRGTAETVLALPGFWFDIDFVGPGHAEQNLPVDKDAAKEFVESLPIKPSLIVFTGGGVHLYFLFKEIFLIENETERQQLKNLSRGFQGYIISKARQQFGWQLDNTSDHARLLRIPGTYNHKTTTSMLVYIIKESNLRYTLDDFEEYQAIDIERPTVAYNDKTSVDKKDYPLSDSNTIVNECAFIRDCIEHGEKLPEPRWIAMLSIVLCCVDGENLAHEWSKPYLKYSHRETDNKIAHVKAKISPHTCKRISEELGCSECKSCQHWGKIISPIKLGFPKVMASNYSKPAIAQVDGEQLKWQSLRQMFPRTPYPSDIFPDDLEESIQQLARSCATSSNSLYGVALAIIASSLGKKVSVSPKEEWNEFPIIFHGDLKNSGQGKTPAAGKLCEPLYDLQEKEMQRYYQKLEQFKQNAKLPPKNRAKLSEPLARNYIVNDYTCEAIGEFLQEHPTSGFLIDVVELSQIISMQNQYKNGGTDRESFLRLYDGKDNITLRKSSLTYSRGPRISIIGGIQPRVFKNVFGGKDQLYISDGTIYRFIFVYEPDRYRPKTSECWSDDHRAKWHNLVCCVTSWAESAPSCMNIVLSPAAQTRFLDWCNSISEQQFNMPAQFRGFIPKAHAYCLRLALVIHCLRSFHLGGAPSSVMDLDGIERGIKAIEFHLGQAVDAMMTLLDIKGVTVAEDDGSKKQLLVETISKLKDRVDKGRIPFSELLSEFNRLSASDQQLGSSRDLGVLLRQYGLTVSDTAQRANDKVGTCLLWDNDLENFIGHHDGAHDQSLICKDVKQLLVENKNNEIHDQNHICKDVKQVLEENEREEELTWGSF